MVNGCPLRSLDASVTVLLFFPASIGVPRSREWHLLHMAWMRWEHFLCSPFRPVPWHRSYGAELRKYA